MKTAIDDPVDGRPDVLEADDNRFLEVTYASGDKEILYFKDFNSGAMIENIVRRAKKEAIKRFLSTGRRGSRPRTSPTRSATSSRRTRTCPTRRTPTTGPDLGQEGRADLRPHAPRDGDGEGRQVERVSAGQYL